MNQTKVAVKIAVSAFAFAALLTPGMARAQQDEPYYHIGRRQPPPPPPPQASGYQKTRSPLPPQYPPCEYRPCGGDIPHPRPFPPKPLEDRGMQRALKETIEALSSGASGETTSMSASKTFDALGKFLNANRDNKTHAKISLIRPVDCMKYCDRQSTNTVQCSQSCYRTANGGKTCHTTCS